MQSGRLRYLLQAARDDRVGVSARRSSGSERAAVLKAALVAVFFIGVVGSLHAQEGPERAADATRGIEVQSADRVISVVVVALPEPRVQRVAARRASARRRARAEAIRRLQRFVDVQLRRYALDLRRHQALHRVIEERAQIARQDALVDHGVRLVMVVPFAALHDAAPLRGVVWSL